MVALITEVDDDAIEIVQQNIEKYLAYYRKYFPTSIFSRTTLLGGSCCTMTEMMVIWTFSTWRIWWRCYPSKNQQITMKYGPCC